MHWIFHDFQSCTNQNDIFCFFGKKRRTFFVGIDKFHRWVYFIGGSGNFISLSQPPQGAVRVKKTETYDNTAQFMLNGLRAAPTSEIKQHCRIGKFNTF